MRHHRLTAITSLTSLLLAGLLAACGGGGNSATTTTTTSASSETTLTSTATTQPPTPTGRRIGVLIEVVAPTVNLNGGSVSSRTDLHERDVIETLQAGEVDFSVEAKVKSCRTLKDSRLRVEPVAGTLIQWDQGSAICVTAASGGTARFGAGGRTVLTAVDPVFEVTVDQGITTVKVDKGFVSLAANGSSQKMIVGFNEMAQVPSDAGPQGLGPFHSADDPNSAVFGQFAKSLPPVAYTKPSQAGSPALQAIFARGHLNIQTAANPGTSEHDFLDGAFSKLSKVWGLQSPNWVTSGPVDIWVAPAGQAASAFRANVATQPLFEVDGTAWTMTFPADRGLANGLKSWTRSYLNSGDYGGAFDAAFGGQIPRYDTLSPVLFSN